MVRFRNPRLVFLMFKADYQHYLDVIETALDEALPPIPLANGGLVVEAARYSLLSGGKRIRPVLLLATLDCLQGSHLAGIRFAVALEMIHTYSLIHDDLPCMDDDDLRRGRPTCHRQYSEALAILAGDTLLNYAYEYMLEDPASSQSTGLNALKVIARAAGAAGMIGGQTLDLSFEGRQVTAAELRQIHALKTGQLILASVQAACSLAAADNLTTDLMRQFADNLGLAFQIQDDILDVTATEGQLGKSVGKDTRDNKSTYVSLYGLSQAQLLLADATHQAEAALDKLAQAGYPVTFLKQMTQFLLERKH